MTSERNDMPSEQVRRPQGIDQFAVTFGQVPEEVVRYIEHLEDRLRARGVEVLTLGDPPRSNAFVDLRDRVRTLHKILETRLAEVASHFGSCLDAQKADRDKWSEHFDERLRTVEKVTHDEARRFYAGSYLPGVEAVAQDPPLVIGTNGTEQAIGAYPDVDGIQVHEDGSSMERFLVEWPEWGGNHAAMLKRLGRVTDWLAAHGLQPGSVHLMLRPADLKSIQAHHHQDDAVFTTRASTPEPTRYNGYEIRTAVGVGRGGVWLRVNREAWLRAKREACERRATR